MVEVQYEQQEEETNWGEKLCRIEKVGTEANCVKAPFLIQIVFGYFVLNDQCFVNTLSTFHTYQDCFIKSSPFPFIYKYEKAEHHTRM